jgi:Tol biopolymer transport system component
MPLTPGRVLGSYEILAALGAGGMGEVYRAKDTKLGREVAIKILPDSFTRDPDRLARFRREAQILAALNHPHIGAIYGLTEWNGLQFLVLELVDGEGLDRRIARGPLPVDQALSIAGQIGEALAAAHDKGIVHRDLKPSNIGLTREGSVKILDFGLAKAAEAPGAPSLDVTHSPTLTTPGMATGVGVILGTAAYMSPEQARGHAADRRSDIWAFGCVVYEMLTGRRIFAGDTVTDTLAAVLTREPEWQRVPERARRLLRHCLERDPRCRLRDIGDIRCLLEDAPPAPIVTSRARLPWALTAALTVALGLALALRPERGDRPLIRLDLDLGAHRGPNVLVPAMVSPDGSRLVFHTLDSDGRDLLATRRLDDSKATPLVGTEGGDQPFFSPDGQWVGFFSARKLKKISIHGGTPITLCDASIARGASWGDDGYIVTALSNASGLSRVPVGGGEPQPVTTLAQGEPTHRWPQVLPGAEAVIFTANSPTLNSYENATIDVQSLRTGERRTLWRGGYFGRYVPSTGSRGHLAFVRNGVLFVVPFDPDRLQIEGAPAPLLEQVGADPGSGAGRFDFSRTGVFVFESGTGMRPWTVAWLDSTGKTQPLLPKPGLYYSPRFSPDGRRLAVGIDSGKGADIFVHDLERDAVTRLTFTSRLNSDPVWAPDGKHLIFRDASVGGTAIWWIAADGAGEAQRLLDVRAGDIGSNSFSPDGRTLIYSTYGEPGNSRLWTVTLDLSDPDHPSPAAPQPFYHSPFNETRPAFSPDGRWVAYVSDESGRNEIYVRSFSAAATGHTGKWQISTNGGQAPLWSHDRRSLFFTSDDRVMMAEYTSSGASFTAGKPRLWSTTPIRGNTGFSNYDVAPDGKRLAVFVPSDAGRPEEMTRLTLLLNFFDELRRRSPKRSFFQ